MNKLFSGMKLCGTPFKMHFLQLLNAFNIHNESQNIYSLYQILSLPFILYSLFMFLHKHRQRVALIIGGSWKCCLQHASPLINTSTAALCVSQQMETDRAFYPLMSREESGLQHFHRHTHRNRKCREQQSTRMLNFDNFQDKAMKKRVQRASTWISSLRQDRTRCNSVWECFLVYIF